MDELLIFILSAFILFFSNTNIRLHHKSILHLSCLSLFFLSVLALFTWGSINNHHLCGVALNPQTASVLQQEHAKHTHTLDHTHAASTSIISPPPPRFFPANTVSMLPQRASSSALFSPGFLLPTNPWQSWWISLISLFSSPRFQSFA